MKILYLHDSGFTPGFQGQLEQYSKKAQIDMGLYSFANLTQGMVVQSSETKRIANPETRAKFFSMLTQAIDSLKPRSIVINDWVALEYITGKYRSLDLTRSGIYFVNGVPAIVVDSFRTAMGTAKLKAVPHAGWVLLQDLKKLKRWTYGNQRQEPVFNFDLVVGKEQLAALQHECQHSLLIAVDIETTGRGRGCLISCLGLAILTKDGRVISRTVPFIWPTFGDGIQWRCPPDYDKAINTLRTILANPVAKVLQNGTYDAHHLLRYKLPITNYFFDTANAFHSLWPEAPKRIDFISSIGCDRYRFWKDENKADEKDDAQADSLPTSESGWASYLRYCALDCHYTLGSAMYLLQILGNVPWAMENYRQSFRQSVGPGLAMSLRGVRVNEQLQTAFELQNMESSEQAKRDMVAMTRGLDFNPASPAQVANLIYNICKATPLPKRGKQAKGANRDTLSRSKSPAMIGKTVCSL